MTPPRYLAALLIALPGAAAAQTDAVRQPTAAVAGANTDVAVAADVSANAQSGAALDAKAQYAADMAAYNRTLDRNDRRQRRYARNQRAYADAMAAWRIQVRDCHQGVTAACNAPTPDPAAFR